MVYYGKEPKNLPNGRYCLKFREKDIFYDDEIHIYRECETAIKNEFGGQSKKCRIPKKLKEALLLIKDEIIRDFDSSWRPAYYVKYAKLRFIYNNHVYDIGAYTLGLDFENSYDNYFSLKSLYIMRRLDELLGIKDWYYDDFLD